MDAAIYLFSLLQMLCFAIAIALLIGLPIVCIIHCVRSKRERGRKTTWILSMAFTWVFASIIYAIVGTKNLIIRSLAAIFTVLGFFYLQPYFAILGELFLIA